MSAKNNIIFGPVNSRRFGMSLGIDLSPSAKQCNFDCLYCELAPSAAVKEQTFVVSVDEIITQLRKHLHDKIDVITLTANGEPTLYPHLDRLIDAINKIKKDTQTLILTNSATLVNEKVFSSLLKLDQVKLSLDAVSHDIFKKIDRPHPSIKIENVVQKVIDFSQKYRGKLFIEILFVHGINDTQEEIQKLNEVLHKIKCQRVDIGTIDRPPAYPVTGISYKELHTIALMFDADLPIHIASRLHAEPNNSRYTKEEVLNTLDKRPLTPEDIALLFDEKSRENLNNLLTCNAVTVKKVGNLEFYVPTDNLKRKRHHSNGH
ncbi:radical SAM protein [Sulfurimonas sediminis]|uniref:radical SAM protein n=1 Tax=Sulfurimonas sediminis TaxID=2590020 RepID=UPI001D038E15|nr:radical SAM protein [Sulfurimonas sediminis]